MQSQSSILLRLASLVVAVAAPVASIAASETFRNGQSIYGQTMWYRLAAPHRGYVTAYYVQADAGDVIHAC